MNKASHYIRHLAAPISTTLSTHSGSESGRDQSHVQLGLGNMAELCQTAHNQGDYSYWDLLNERLMAGYEYTATYNLGSEVEYDPSFYRYVSSEILFISFYQLSNRFNLICLQMRCESSWGSVAQYLCC